MPNELLIQPEFIPRDYELAVIAWCEENSHYLQPIPYGNGKLSARMRMMLGKQRNAEYEFPEIFYPLRIEAQKYFPEEQFNQLIINRYLTKEGIGAHIDAADIYGPVVFGVSFGSSAKMIFRRNDESETYALEPRMAYAMTCECRYYWTHEVSKAVRHTTRWSVTMRTIR